MATFNNLFSTKVLLVSKYKYSLFFAPLMRTFLSLSLFLKFLICGSLSIYTEVYPSKKLVGRQQYSFIFPHFVSLSYLVDLIETFFFLQVTVCLSMYIVSVLGIIVSFIYRMIHLIFQGWGRGMRGVSRDRLVSLIGSQFQRFPGNH